MKKKKPQITQIKKVKVKVEVEEEVPFGQINACGISSSHLLSFPASYLPSFRAPLRNFVAKTME